MKLSSLKRGEKFLIVRTDTDGETRSRLAAFGFSSGVAGRVVAFSCGKGVRIELCGRFVGVEKTVAERTEVEKLP